MKRIAFIFLLLILLLPLWADNSYVLYQDPSVKIITAYKNALTAGTPPALTASIRLLDTNQEEFHTNDILALPATTRNTEYNAFSWVISGNALNDVYLRFRFGQLCLNGETTNISTQYIPYEVKLVYGTSRVGNSVLKVNTQSTSSNPVVNTFTIPNYRFFYADKVTGAYSDIASASVAASVLQSEAQVSVTYNMKTNTKIQDANGNDKKNQYTLNVCDYWNRTGYVFLKLLITHDGTWASDASIPLVDGLYYATVVVEVYTQ